MDEWKWESGLYVEQLSKTRAQQSNPQHHAFYPRFQHNFCVCFADENSGVTKTQARREQGPGIWYTLSRSQAKQAHTETYTHLHIGRSV